jgi:hypothetical protein
MKLDWLVLLLDEIAVTTWHLLELSRALGNHTSEPTITEISALRLRAASVVRGYPLQVHQFTQLEDRAKGADLELWVETRSGDALGYSIQAKRLFSGEKTKNYRQLKERDEKTGDYQYERLVAQAATVGSIPIHVFYNGGDIEEVPALVTSWRQPHNIYGCAAARTTDVLKIRQPKKGIAHRGTNASLFTGSQFPWSDLFRMPSASRTDGQPATTSVADLTSVARGVSHADTVLASGLPLYLSQPSLDPSQYGSLPNFAVVVTEPDEDEFEPDRDEAAGT